MPTTSQPAAGTAVHADWTTGMVMGRNDAETTASTLAVGTATYAAVGAGVVFASDADGRYIQGAGSSGFEQWNLGGDFGPEYTILVLIKWASSGGEQWIVGRDLNPPRKLWLVSKTTGVPEAVLFKTTNTFDTSYSAGSTAIPTSGVTSVLLRVRNDAGTYKAKLQVGTTAIAEQAYSGTPESVTGSETICFGARDGAGRDSTAQKIYARFIWNYALSDSDMNALGANGWAVYDSNTPASDLTGNVTLNAVSPAGTLADAGPTSLSGGVTLDAVAPSGTLGLQPGTVTASALKNWSGSLQTSVTIPVVTVLSMTTGAQVLALTDQVTHAITADLAITSTSLIPGVTYMVAGWNADGSQRFAVPLAAT